MNAATFMHGLYVFSIISFVISAYVLLLTLCNNAWLRFSARQKPAQTGPRINVLIPARNEEQNIVTCLNSMLAQEYDNYSIIVYDDDSTDATGQILDDYAARYPDKVRVIHGKGLPAGWYGKPHAMQCLSEASDADYLFFVDADTTHKPDSIGRFLAVAQRYDADLVTGYAWQAIGSFGEAIVVPSIYILNMIAMPLWLIHRTKAPGFSHAIGQIMFFKASKYREIGGYTLVKQQVTEDVRIARELKKQGGKVVFIDAKPSVTCRMYSDYKSSMKGVSKNIFDYFNKNTVLLSLATVAAVLFLFGPLAGVIITFATNSVAKFFFLGAFLGVFLAWVAVTVQRRLPWYVPFVFPVIFVNDLSGAWYARRVISKGNAIEWKGRFVK
ncbi:MAG TPA: glycosyltransferase family 2 protein [Spirochaetales bacterium]|nr:glycosyltransferase family 2 protein [Spirochaetales bacterium]